jgi:hypothetical protein
MQKVKQKLRNPIYRVLKIKKKKKKKKEKGIKKKGG